jgi:hypothetical protein
MGPPPPAPPAPPGLRVVAEALAFAALLKLVHRVEADGAWQSRERGFLQLNRPRCMHSCGSGCVQVSLMRQLDHETGRLIGSEPTCNCFGRWPPVSCGHGMLRICHNANCRMQCQQPPAGGSESAVHCTQARTCERLVAEGGAGAAALINCLVGLLCRRTMGAGRGEHRRSHQWCSAAGPGAAEMHAWTCGRVRDLGGLAREQRCSCLKSFRNHELLSCLLRKGRPCT